MHHKSILAMAAIATISVLSGCNSGSTGSEAAKPSTDSAKSTFKVALLTPGKVSDAGWNALAYDGLQAIQKELGAEVANQEAAGPDKIKDAMRAYAQKGFNLVIGHGFEYNEVGIKVATDFPNTVFVSSSGPNSSKNAGAFRFYLEQGCYLAGMLAAKVSKTGAVGSVAVQNYPSIVSTLKAFEAGAKAANPKIKIIPTSYFGAEGDIAKAKQSTEQVIAAGADVIIHQANDAAQGVFDACKEKGVVGLGTNADQNANSSGIVLASATIVARPAFVELAKQVQAGKYVGSVQLFDMSKGAIDFVINPTLAKTLPADVIKLIDETKEKIKSGKLIVPKDNF